MFLLSFLFFVAVFSNSGFKRTLCGNKWDPVKGLTGDKNAFKSLGSSTARYGCCPARTYMSSPFIAFVEVNSCSACPAGKIVTSLTSVPNDETRCMPEGVCEWTDLSTHQIAAGTYSVPDPECKMKHYIDVRVDVTINGGTIGSSYYELQSKRVDNKNKRRTSSDFNYRHFQITSPGKLTLNHLKLTWGEAGQGNGGSIIVYSGTLAINYVYFYGKEILKTANTDTSVAAIHASSGGAIQVNDGKVTIASSTFEGWRAKHGGAIHVVKTSEPMTIESTKFVDNYAMVCFSLLFFLHNQQSIELTNI